LSLPNLQELRPAQSTELNRVALNPTNFTTATVTFFLSMQQGGWGVAAKIINNDAANSCTFRLHSNRGVARIVPPSSEITINEWFDILIIEPDATDGQGQVEIDIVRFQEAKRRQKVNG